MSEVQISKLQSHLSAFFKKSYLFSAFTACISQRVQKTKYHPALEQNDTRTPAWLSSSFCCSPPFLLGILLAAALKPTALHIFL